VDAREQLRRYLEQRRELGETELALDGLNVDDALRILGANTAARPAEQAVTQGAPARRVTEASGPSDMTDWRHALREAGASPDDMPSKKPSEREEMQTPPAVAAPVAPSAPTTPAAPATSIALADVPHGQDRVQSRCLVRNP
jgi:hypothetical protein